MLTSSKDRPVLEDFLHPSDNTVCQAHLNAVRVGSGLCQKVLDDPFRPFAGALILFLNHPDSGAYLNF